ncbi:zinc finger HIT domain-containing protein 3 [Myxocyprinus asiaticus]|uniref:zinc finger HIT domain-containing protein 3 n=1 Tax=Myxocyprinus asiaticus TaxID=70543 RepID=UPI0022236D8F|nr:zinc finger HIT domain-containing protein 3 [Myxocyprinus asiaticus]XP_051524271.1 zinc finger HIT domain-containing protein 3 [Myxocyprinus asiaticus]XP_051524279.1 zinc finger HIT domain-containing protein 3 [Myxocyprinus asiaticus]
MQLCGVCSEQVPKYRCPACRIRYCSVSCFKRHKDDDSCHPFKETAPPVSTPTPVSHAEQPWTVDDLLDEDSQSDKVPLQKLQQLGESEALKALLWNPHLRQVMMSVDSAEDKAKAVKNAMQEPLFVEFADQCLKIIEPAQMDDDDDDV